MRTNRLKTMNTVGLLKISKASAALLFAVALMPGITGCSDDNDFAGDNSAEKEQSQRVEITSFDDLAGVR